MQSIKPLVWIRRWAGHRNADAWFLSNIGAIVRGERHRRGWSQAKLAEAAGVSERTIQRLESGGGCARSTVLRVQALLGACDAEESSRLDAGGQQFWIAPHRALWLGMVLSAPGILFVVVNLLRYPLGFSAFPDPFAELLHNSLFNALSPLIFLGGPLLGVLLNLAAQMRVRSRVQFSTWQRIELLVRMRGANLGLVLVSMVAVAILTGYLLMENLGHWIEELAQVQ